METKTSKRIVSKGAYARALSAKSFLMLFGVAGGIFIFILTVNLWHLLSSKPDDIPMLPIASLFLLVTAVYICVLCMAMRLVKIAKSIDTGVPITRASTANLPAPESLVRASQEPIQAREVVLLRAAAEGQETSPEEMLRASAERE